MLPGMMLRTPLCDLLGIEVPIVCAPFGPWDQVDLAAAVCGAGALGSLGTAMRTPPELEAQWRRLRALTPRPFAVNHTARPFDDAAFEATLAFRPAVVSFHLGDPGELVTRAHDAGCLWMQQVMDVTQACQALERGADVIVAQGGEAGGHAGFVSTMALVPQVVDVAGDVPVVAAGGIADGRGLAAALALGAQGVAMGTRFLASTEMSIAPDWKRRLVEAASADAIQPDVLEVLMPPYNRPHWPALGRILRTPLSERWTAHPEELAGQAERIGQELVAAVRAGGGEDYVPFAGQSVGLVREILPAAEIVRRVMDEAERALARLA